MYKAKNEGYEMKLLVEKSIKSVAIMVMVFVLLICITLCGCDSADDKATDTDTNTNIDTVIDNSGEILSAEELIERFDEFDGTKVTVRGVILDYSWEENGIWHNCFGTDDELCTIGTLGIDEKLPASYELTATGIVYYEQGDLYMKVESYNVGDFIERGFTIEKKQEACKRFDNMNWRTFYEYTDKYNDGQTYYFVGKVISHDGYGSGLMQLVEGDNRTIIQYCRDPICNEETNFYEGSVIAIYGTVSADGRYTYQDTGDSYACPMIHIKAFQNCETEITSLSESERAFVYGKYVNKDGYYEYFPGKDFEFTEEYFAGYPYQLKSIKYTCGTVLMSSYDNCANRMSINVSIEVNKDGEKIPLTLMLYLDEDVKLKHMSGAGTDYYVRQG